MKRGTMRPDRGASTVKAPSVWDRIVFGAISGVCGAILGLAAALLVAMVFRTSAGVAASVVCSTLYFFCVGFLRGPDAGFLVAEALSAAGLLVRAGTVESMGVPPEDHRDHPRNWAAPWLLLAWFVMVVLVTWRS